jgi:hypothetical protein
MNLTLSSTQESDNVQGASSPSSVRDRMIPVPASGWCPPLNIAFEHEEVPGIVEQSFLIDVAVVVLVETLAHRLDQSSDDVLESLQ